MLIADYEMFGGQLKCSMVGQGSADLNSGKPVMSWYLWFGCGYG